MVKTSFALGTVGLFLILAEAENIITDLIPNGFEIPLGVILLIYSGYRLGKRNFRIKV